MQHQIARITVQRSFCHCCVDHITSEIQKTLKEGFLNIYPLDAMVVFTFKRAQEVSDVLNTLVRLGYPPVGDLVQQQNIQAMSCACAA